MDSGCSPVITEKTDDAEKPPDMDPQEKSILFVFDDLRRKKEMTGSLPMFRA